MEKNTIALIILALIAGIGFGYFLGWEHGWNGGTERLLRTLDPASHNCSFTLEGIVEFVGEGPYVGYCHLPDGRVCELVTLHESGTCVSTPSMSEE